MKKNMYTPTNLLIGLAVKHGGDWERIASAVAKHEWKPSECELRAIVGGEYKHLSRDRSDGCIITICDDGYPEALRGMSKPPFVLFAKDGRVSTIPFSLQEETVAVTKPKAAKGLTVTIRSEPDLDEAGDPVEDPSVKAGTVAIEIEYADLDGEWDRGRGCLHGRVGGVPDSKRGIAKAIGSLRSELAEHIRQHPERYSGIGWADFFVRRRDGDDDNPESADVQEILKGAAEA